eukprot:m.32312 g.32312  ORF g.32312 m.32312 type:complete len:80 (+) comp9503_c0_seq1:3562-3801(+)
MSMASSLVSTMEATMFVVSLRPTTRVLCPCHLELLVAVGLFIDSILHYYPVLLSPLAFSKPLTQSFVADNCKQTHFMYG